MKQLLHESIDIPEGITCKLTDKTLSCSKGSNTLSRTLDMTTIDMDLKEGKVNLTAKRGSKKEFKVMRTFFAHIRNMFGGLNAEYVYKLESCNLHFPMTLKVEKNTLVIGNFLGEKVPRKAVILPSVDIDVKGAKITLTSRDKEAAGLTATNIEKATKIRLRDRRIFQDGIFITSKPEDTK